MKEIALNILDIVQNSVRAGSQNVWITVVDSQKENRLAFTIRDDGHGMTREIRGRMVDPFFTSRLTRRVGLGIPLLIQQAEAAGGGVHIISEPGKGATLEARFVRDHIDRQPVGDIPGTLKVLYRIDPIEIFFRYITDEGEYSLSTTDIRECLGVRRLNDPVLLGQLDGMIRSNLEEIFAVDQQLKGEGERRCPAPRMY